jgi:hypothetical protein
MGHMSASTRSTDPAPLRLVPTPEPAEDPRPVVVAVILADGSVRELARRPLEEREPTPAWASGSLAGEGWTLWWERRTY